MYVLAYQKEKGNTSSPANMVVNPSAIWPESIIVAASLWNDTTMSKKKFIGAEWFIYTS